MKIGSERAVVRAVFERDHHRCVVCGFDLRCALAAHHRVPRELGGRDTPANLTTLCANCHKAVHWLSVGGRLNASEGGKARKLYSASAFGKLARLAEAIQDHRAKVKHVGNRWVKHADSDGPMPLSDALGLIVRRHHFDSARAALLERVVHQVLGRLPADVLKGCSVRLVQRGRFLSINAGNILLFRVPGVFDGVKDPDGDVIVIWPEHTRLSVLSRAEWREIEAGEGTFAAVPSFNLPLDFQQVLKMNSGDWSAFTNACREAVRAGKSRHWVSNVTLLSGQGAVSGAS